MQRQNTGDHPPSEAALWRVFSTRQISAAKAEKDCIKGKKGTQTVQNDQSLCRQQSERRKKRRLFPTVQYQNRPSSEPTPVSWQVAVSQGSAGLHLMPVRTQAHTALSAIQASGESSYTQQNQNVLKLRKWSEGCLG